MKPPPANLVRTSRAAIFDAPGLPLRHVVVAVPALRDGEILIRNEYATLCRSDLNTFSGKRSEKTPTILGHEIVGVIEAMAPGAPARDLRGAELRAGDRVTWAIYASDPGSAMARLGLPQKGPDLFKYGHEQFTPASTLHGGLAEYCVLRRHTPVVRLEASVPLPLLALINCAVATVAGSLRLAGPVAGRHVVIAGAGMLGLMAAAMCRLADARTITAVDVSEARLATARRFGADATVQITPGGLSLPEALAAGPPHEPVTVGLDYSGAPETMEGLIALLGVGGIAVFVGATFPQRPIQVSAEDLIRRVLTIKGLHNYNGEDLVAAVGFMERHHRRFPFESLVQGGFDLETATEAFHHGLHSGAYRVGINLSAGLPPVPPSPLNAP